LEQSLALSTTDKSPSNPNSPMPSRTNKVFQKFGIKRQKQDSSPSESTDPLLLSYNKSYEGEAPLGESEDAFEMQDDKKKKKRSFLRKVSKFGRAQSNPADKARSSDSDDKVQAFTTDSFNTIDAWPYNKPSSASRTAAKSMDDLSAIPETNTNNNNTARHLPSQNISHTRSLWGFNKKLKEKKSEASLQVDQSQVIIKSAPSTPEKHRKKHSSMPSFNGTARTKLAINPDATIVESNQVAIPECTTKRRSSDATKHNLQERHRSFDQDDLKVINSIRAANSNVARASSLNYGDKPNHYAAQYKQQYPIVSPLGSQPSFFSSSTIDSQDSLNAVSQ